MNVLRIHHPDVIIVGGGISGLAAAYELQRRGAGVRLFEASDRLGGVIRSDRFDGWVVDGGPDSLLVQKPAAVALCRELGIGHRLFSTIPPRTAYILRNGRLHPLPEGSFLGFPLKFAALSNSTLFSFAGKLRMAANLVVAPAGPHPDLGDMGRWTFELEALGFTRAGDCRPLLVRFANLISSW